MGGEAGSTRVEIAPRHPEGDANQADERGYFDERADECFHGAQAEHRRSYRNRQLEVVAGGSEGVRLLQGNSLASLLRLMLSMEEMPSICRRLFLRAPLFLATALMILCTLSAHVSAEPIPATHKQGSMHGFLLLKSEDGKVIAIGDQVNVVRGDEIRSSLVFHFRDGSLDEEISTFRQRSVFELVKDRHVQKGLSFPTPLDMTVNVRDGEVMWREMKDGKNEIKTEHMDLPPDLVNGMMSLVVQNFPATAGELKVSYLAMASKPRVVKLSIKPDDEDKVLVGGAGRRANRFNVHVEIGGVAGAVAPLIGKQPSDIKLWVLDGEVPSFIKMEGPLYEKGPIWSMVLTSPTWPSNSPRK
jgi:hypothetical protein